MAQPRAASPRHSGAVLGWAALLPGAWGTQALAGQHEHAGGHGHQRRLPLQRGGDARSGLFAAGRADVYFDTSALIITLILLGRLLEARAKGRTNEAIKKLAGLQAKTARVVRGGEELDVPVESVEIGDVVVVRPGEKIPVDGRVVSGVGGGRVNDHGRVHPRHQAGG